MKQKKCISNKLILGKLKYNDFNCETSVKVAQEHKNGNALVKTFEKK